MEDENQPNPTSAVQPFPESDGTESTAAAAVKLQKVYRSYRTRRRLADSAVVAEELWWKAIDYAQLNRSTVSFFNFSKRETAFTGWMLEMAERLISRNARGQGFGKNASYILDLYAPPRMTNDLEL